MTFNN